MSEDVLNTHDFISVVPEYPSGFFALYKNSEKMNKLFTLSKDYKSLFLKKENTLFEECGGYYDDVINGVNILNTNCPSETFHHILEKNKNSVRSLFDFFSIQGSPGVIKIKKEMIIFMNEYEVMMYHLTNYKTNFYRCETSWKKIPKNYTIYKYSFTKNSVLSKLSSAVYDASINLLFKITKKIDSLFSVPTKANFKTGVFRYMQEYVELKKENKCYTLKTTNQNSSISKSLFFKKLFYLNQKDLYFFISKENNQINLIYENGYVLVYELD